MSTQTLSAESEIRKEFQNWLEAVRNRDIATLKTYYAPDFVTFDALPPLQLQGEAYWKNWQMCFDDCTDMSGYDINELNVVVDGSVAFTYSLQHFVASSKSGGEMEHWLRATICYRKIDGAWRITHEHYSFPFDHETGKAVFTLKP